MEQIIKDVLDGNKNALQIFVDLKRSEKEIKNALDQIKDLAIIEAETYSEKVFKEYDAEITMKSGGGTWDFKHLDWFKDFKDKQEQAKLAYKATATMVDDDGEIIDPAVFNPNSETISIKL